MFEVKGSTRWFRSVALLVVSAGLGGCDENPLIHQDNAVTRKAYENLAIAWSHWALENPWSAGPLLDTDGSKCAMGQSGPVWYLAGTPGDPVAVERECTIPHGKKLFFPLINRWVAPPPEVIIEGDPENDLQAWIDWVTGYFADSRAATCELTLRIDGQDLLPDLDAMDDELYVEILDPFDIELGDDNFATESGGGPGPRVTWVDGNFALLRPLPPGDYTLELGGRMCDEDDGTLFETSATYTLHIEEE